MLLSLRNILFLNQLPPICCKILYHLFGLQLYSILTSQVSLHLNYSVDSSVSETVICRISVTFVLKDGEEQQIRVPTGMSMLEAAHLNDIELEGKEFDSSCSEKLRVGLTTILISVFCF